MNMARESASVGVLNGLIYAIGGANGQNVTLASVERYDRTTNAWSLVAPMHTHRKDSGVAVVNDHLYAVGGMGH